MQIRRVRLISAPVSVAFACVLALGAQCLVTTPARAATTSVLTVGPLSPLPDSVTQVMANTFSRFATRNGVQVSVPTNSDLTWAGMVAGRDQVRDAIRRTPGPKIVFGYSRGAQFASEWIRAFASAADAPPAAQLRFVFIGNPQRRLGGSTFGTIDGQQLLPTPDTSQYRVDDYIRNEKY